MSRPRLTYAEHVAFYQQQQLRRKRKQFESMGHPLEASVAVEPPSSHPAPTTGDHATDDTTGAKRPQQGAPTQKLPIAPPPMAPPVDPAVRIRLRLDSGRYAGHVFALREGEYMVGRAPEADIRLEDYTVSHYHARIVVTSGRTTVQDLGSLNGSKLDDQPLQGTMVVFPGQHIVFGATRLVVERGG